MSNNQISIPKQIPLCFKTHLQLSKQYSNSKNNYDNIIIHILVYSIPSNYLTKYKELIIWNDIEKEYLKRYYHSNQSKRKIPLKAIYYKNYLKFFCRPFMWNLHYDQILQEYINQKAKTFYKEVYWNIHNKQIEEQQHIEVDISKQKLNKEKERNKDMNTIFDSSTRKVIDYNLVTTLDIDDKEVNELKKNAEAFCTIGAKNDFLIDLLTSLSNKKKKRNNNYFGLNSRLLALSPTDTLCNAKKKRRNTFNTNTNSNSNYDNHISIIPNTKHKMKSSLCNIYFQNNFPMGTKTKSNGMINNKNIKETRAFQLLSPKYQMKSNYSEFKKYNSQSKSKSKTKSKSKGDNSSIKRKSFSNINDAQKPQYTSYNKSNCHKQSIDNNKSKSLEKQRILLSNKNKVNSKIPCNKSKISFMLKDPLSPQRIINNLLFNYLNNCSNSRQTKKQCSNYLSMRNISNEKTLPSQLKYVQHKNSDKHQHSMQLTSNNNNSHYHIANTAYNIIEDKSDKQKKSTQTEMNKGLRLSHYFILNNIDFKRNTSKKSNNQITSPSASCTSIINNICRNHSNSNIINKKQKYSNNTTEVVKLTKNIQRNQQVNKIVNDISSKNNKSTKHNDSSQTSSNTHQGHAHSKSPKVINKTKETPNNSQAKNNLIIKYTTKKLKNSRRSSPGNCVSPMFSFSSQRK